jgi:hypothetical protein
MSGLYGWWCACGFDTRESRDGISQEEGAACYACKRLYEHGETTCDACRASLTPLDSEGSFLESSDTGSAREYFRERLFDETLRHRHWLRDHPQPPFPSDAMPAPPGWTRNTAETRAYDAWFTGMFASWKENKPRALADEALVESVRTDIEPKVEACVRGLTYANRKYRCPRCGALTLGFHAMPFPR